MKTHTLTVNGQLLDQIIWSLQQRLQSLNSLPGVDSELITHTNAALQLALETKHQTKGLP
jgi:hypothetical protein